MSLPDIDFRALRDHLGNKSNAFEELCCQLAGDEPMTPARSDFVRKGRGADGGLECFATLADGSETGWQVKYYWDIASAIGSLDESLTQALTKHPAMTRFIACMPIDLSDSRRDDVVTALQRWEDWKARREAEAAAMGRTLIIDRWDAFALRTRLTASNPQAAGRVAFWFDQALLTPDWFRARLERTIDTLGRRYSPEAHVELPIRRAIAASLGDPELQSQLQAFSATIKARLVDTRTRSRPLIAIETALQTLNDAGPRLGEASFIESLRSSLDRAQQRVLLWRRALARTNGARAPTAEEKAVSNLFSAITAVRHELAEGYWDLFGAPALLVTGEAGTGKSHLLADACRHQTDRDCPAIMILGGKLPDGEPWGEILHDLDLPRDLQAKQFLGALNAAGQAAGVKCLIAIDALNEGAGQAIWPSRLAGLLHDAAQFDWVSVVLSCRSTYEEVVVPEELGPKTLPRVDHEGFTIDEARRYLKKRGISLAEEPNPVEELENPLFLRICCDALAEGGEALLSNGLGGVTETFDLYTRAVTGRVQKQLNVAPARKIPEKVIGLLAQEMGVIGRGDLAIGRAYELSATIFPSASIDEDVLFQLENEGLLARDPGYGAAAEDTIRFTFERMGDHAIAKSLLDRSARDGDVSKACAPDSPLRAALVQEGSRIVGGLIEALAVQLPERFGTELPDLPDRPAMWGMGDAFRESLVTRGAKHFTPRTWELVETAGGPSLRYEVLIALSTNPASAYNANLLHQDLLALAMPERDAGWSIHLTESPQAERLVAWVQEADQGAIRSERASLAGTALTWFLTTSSRHVRDRSTKALVALLADRPDLARSLWAAFKAVDDAYLTERLVASIYGAAMQGRWDNPQLLAVAEDLNRDIFATPVVSPNLLTRDHARGVVRYAQAQGALPDGFDTGRAEPPYESPWPIEFVSDATMASFERTYPSGHRGRDEIVASCVSDGDFARYVLDYAVDDWSVARRDAKTIPTAQEVADDWLERFRAKATPAMLTAHDALATALAAAAADRPGALLESGKAAKADFRSVVGEEIFAEWRAEAENWRSWGMYQRPARGRGEPAQFNLAWARRWVCKRAHDLGWSEALHGEFDLSVRSDRHTHQVERIGKKYQWIALYELCARMADNLKPLPGKDGHGDLERLRNIDPSMLIAATEDDGWQKFEQPCFWTPPDPDLSPTTVDGALTWLASDADYLDGLENVAVTNPDDNHRWLVLSGFETWRGGATGLNREAWRRVRCVVVARRNLSKLLLTLKNTHLVGSDDLPAAYSGRYRAYVGEHPWAWRLADPDRAEWIKRWKPYRSKVRGGLAIRATTAEYLAEVSGYDGSIEQNINLNLPAAWLMDALGLHFSDGASIAYEDQQGVVRFMDPSVALTGRSAALVDRDAFLSYLKREKLAAVWAVSGERNVYGGEHNRGFGGRWTFTRLFHSRGDEIVGLPSYRTFDAPDAGQLTALREGAR